METRKDDVIADDVHFTLNYRPTTTYTFLPDASLSAEPDQVWVNLPNLPLVTAISEKADQDFLSKKVYPYFFSKNSIYRSCKIRT